MARVQEKWVFTFDELSDAAKEKARDWWRGNLDSSDYDCVIEDTLAISKLMGIDIDNRTHEGRNGKNWSEPCIWWSGFSSQGDGACFEGHYEYKKGSVKELKAYAPVDERLHRIVEGLFEIQKANFYQLKANVKHRGHYNHAYCTDIDVERWDGKDMTDGAEETVTQLLRDFMNWIYKQLDEHNEYLYSEEQVDEAILCNEYEFYEDGERV